MTVLESRTPKLLGILIYTWCFLLWFSNVSDYCFSSSSLWSVCSRTQGSNFKMHIKIAFPHLSNSFLFNWGIIHMQSKSPFLGVQFEEFWPTCSHVTTNTIKIENIFITSVFSYLHCNQSPLHPAPGKHWYVKAHLTWRATYTYGSISGNNNKIYLLALFFEYLYVQVCI